MRFRNHSSAFLLTTFLLIIRRTSTSKVPLTFGTLAGKRLCYHCHMPVECMSGACYGDFCVKSLVGEKYVSKGCENRSSSFNSRSMAAASENAIQSGEENEMGCVDSVVFGVPNTVCFCNDVDMCNLSTHKAIHSTICLLLASSFLKLLLYN